MSQIIETYSGQFGGKPLSIEIAPMTQEIYEIEIFNMLTWPHSDRMEDAVPEGQRFVSRHNGQYRNFGSIEKLRPRADLGFTRH
jgi:hypothetical protein